MSYVTDVEDDRSRIPDPSRRAQPPPGFSAFCDISTVRFCVFGRLALPCDIIRKLFIRLGNTQQKDPVFCG